MKYILVWFCVSSCWSQGPPLEHAYGQVEAHHVYDSLEDCMGQLAKASDPSGGFCIEAHGFTKSFNRF